MTSSVAEPVRAAQTDAERELIDLLIRQAAADDLSGIELARECGIDHGLWSRVRRGVAGERFGVDACARIVARYPHLRDAAVRYLLDRYPHMRLLLEEDARRKRAAGSP